MEPAEAFPPDEEVPFATLYKALSSGNGVSAKLMLIEPPPPVILGSPAET